MASPDTQWPRYEVFQQSRPGAPYQSVGSVHAPDADIALQNARDVFVRRPQTVGLWVVPAEQILARTREELKEDESWQQAEAAEGGEEEPYHVFQKKSQRRSMSYVTHVGKVQAETPTQALQRAWEQYAGESVYVWWIVPERAIVSTEEGDASSMFRPAHEKEYRLPTAYRTHTLMRELRNGQDEDTQQ